MANKSEQLEQVVSSPGVRTIRLLQNKYGEKRDTVLAEVGETNSQHCPAKPQCYWSSGVRLANLQTKWVALGLFQEVRQNRSSEVCEGEETNLDSW